MSPQPTVLALRALGLGDALTGVAALRGVRRAWPSARLVLAANPAVGEWLRAQGVVDEVLPTDGLAPLTWPGPPPEVAVNLHGRGPQSHRLLQALDPQRLVAFSCPDASYADGPAWVPEDHEVDRWCRLVRDAGGPCDRQDLRLEPRGPRGESIVLHPGAASGSRRWPLDRWEQVVQVLAAAGEQVVVTGSAAERDLGVALAAAASGDGGNRVENLCGQQDLSALAATVAGARLLLCGDTGVAHLATAYGTPSVLLFGPTPPSMWGPALDPDLHRVLWRPEPGDQPGDPHAEQVDPRLERIAEADVLAAVTKELTPVVLPRIGSYGARIGS